MDLENQRRVKEAAEQYGTDQLVVLLGAAEAEAAGLAAETVLNGDPTYSGPLAGVPLGLPAFHILESELRLEMDPAVFEEQLGMMEMVLDVPAISAEVRRIRLQFQR